MDEMESDKAHDPFASLQVEKYAPNRDSPRASNPAPVASHAPTTSTVTTDDISIVVERVVTRIVKETLTPTVERVRLSTEQKLYQVQSALEVIEGTQRALGDKIEALKDLLEAHLEKGEVGGERAACEREEHDHTKQVGEEQTDEKVEERKEHGIDSSPRVSSITIEDVEALRDDLKALMRENEARMKLLDARLQSSGPPPPVRPYVPPPPPSIGSLPPSVSPPVSHHMPPPPPVQPKLPQVPQTLQHPSAVPVERVIDDIAVMGFSREEIRNVLRELVAQGKPIDMNVVLDRLG